MAEKRERSAVGSGFGFGLGGCLGLLAIPAIGLFLLLNSCENAKPAPGTAPGAVDEAGYRPSASELALETLTPEQAGGVITVDVRALNNSRRWLVTANVDCELLVNGESVGISQRGVQQMAPGTSQTMKHRVEGATKTGPISAFCKVIKADFGPGAGRPSP